jgi:homoserine kinase
VTISGSGSALVAVTTEEETQAVAEAMASAMTAEGNPAAPHTPAVSPQGLATLD